MGKWEYKCNLGVSYERAQILAYRLNTRIKLMHREAREVCAKNNLSELDLMLLCKSLRDRSGSNELPLLAQLLPRKQACSLLNNTLGNLDILFDETEIDDLASMRIGDELRRRAEEFDEKVKNGGHAIPEQTLAQALQEWKKQKISEGVAASTVKINIWQYFILLWIVKAFAFFIVASIAIVFSVIFANGIAAYGLTGIILAINYVLYFVIPVTSPIAQLHFLNLGNFLSGTSLFCGEVNLNIFSVPMDVLTISLIIMAVLALVLPIISVLIFVKSKKEKGKLKILSRLPSPHRKEYSSGIFSYECFKLFVSNGAIIIFAVFIAVQVLSYPKKDTLTAYEQCEISYMETLKGEYTEEKLNYLQSEYEENAALSNDNFTARTKAYSIESKLLPLAYHLQELEAQGENAEFVPYSGYAYLFNPDSKTASASACFLILFIAISVTSLFPMEKGTGMNQIYKQMKNE